MASSCSGANGLASQACAPTSARQCAHIVGLDGRHQHHRGVGGIWSLTQNVDQAGAIQIGHDVVNDADFGRTGALQFAQGGISTAGFSHLMAGTTQGKADALPATHGVIHQQDVGGGCLRGWHVRSTPSVCRVPGRWRAVAWAGRSGANDVMPTSRGHGSVMPTV